MTSRKIETTYTFGWILATELEMAPSAWGRPLRSSDARSIAAIFDPDKFGALAVWSRPDLPVLRGRYVVIDGQHRLAAVKLLGWGDQRVPCMLYAGLTTEAAAEVSLGLQSRRNLHALDAHRGALACHDRRASDIDKVLHTLDLDLSYTTKATERGRLSAVSALGIVWDRTGIVGLERVLRICADAWDRTAAGMASQILKLVMTLVAAHDGQIDDERLTRTLAGRSPAEWLAKNSVKPRALSSIAQDVMLEYNKRTRGSSRVEELTPSQYELAAKRRPVPTVRGKIDAPNQTSAQTSPRMRGPGRYSK